MENWLNILHASPPLLVATVTVLGLMVGSFLNVVVHRLPRMMEREWATQCAELRGEPAPPESPRYNLVVPRSACPQCGHNISAIENIPLISYLALRGRCRQCGAHISLRYPAVEALTGILSAYIAWRLGPTFPAIAALFFCWTLIALTFIDLDTQLLPDCMTQPLLWAGLLLNLGNTFVPLPTALIGAVAGYLSLWSVYWLFKLLTGKEGMGYGDFKLLAAIGAWLGWQMLPAVILLSSVVGSIVGLSLIVTKRQGRSQPIPFGPYLAGGGIAGLLWGPALTHAYLGLM